MDDNTPINNLELSPKFRAIAAAADHRAALTHYTNAGLMLVHRLRRWPNIKPTLAETSVATGISCV